MAPPQMKSACFATLLHSRSAGTNGASRIATSIARADSVIPTMAAIQMIARSRLYLLAPGRTRHFSHAHDLLQGVGATVDAPGADEAGSHHIKRRAGGRVVAKARVLALARLTVP